MAATLIRGFDRDVRFSGLFSVSWLKTMTLYDLHNLLFRYPFTWDPLAIVVTILFSGIVVFILLTGMYCRNGCIAGMIGGELSLAVAREVTVKLNCLTRLSA